MRGVLPMVLATVAASGAASAFVLGGGNSDKDCSVAFVGVDQAVGTSGVVCTAGDPSCDADGGTNRSCGFSVSLCTRVSAPRCGAVPLTSIAVAGEPLPLPPIPSATPGCGGALSIPVPVGTSKGVTVLARAGSSLGDVDYLNLCCVSDLEPYAAARCALSVDLRDSGCPSRKIPKALRAGLKRAHALAAEAARHPGRARKLVAKADKTLAGMLGISRKLAKQDPCGNALGLMLKHAKFALARP